MPLARLSSANSPGLIRHEFSPETESPPRGFAALEDVSADVRPTLASWVKETRGGFFKDILEVRKHEVSRHLPNEINSGQGVGLTRRASRKIYSEFFANGPTPLQVRRFCLEGISSDSYGVNRGGGQVEFAS